MNKIIRKKISLDHKKMLGIKLLNAEVMENIRNSPEVGSKISVKIQSRIGAGKIGNVKKKTSHK